MDIVIFNPLVIKFAQDLFRGLAQLDTQMVDQLRIYLVRQYAQTATSPVYAGPRCTSDPPELLQMPPITEAPMQDDPITECGSRPNGLSAFSSEYNVVPG